MISATKLSWLGKSIFPSSTRKTFLRDSTNSLSIRLILNVRNIPRQIIKTYKSSLKVKIISIYAITRQRKTAVKGHKELIRLTYWESIGRITIRKESLEAMDRTSDPK